MSVSVMSDRRNPAHTKPFATPARVLVVAACFALSTLSADSALGLSAGSTRHTGLSGVPPQKARSTSQANPDGFGPLDPTPPTGLSPEELIRKFAARETEFQIALQDYTFRRSVKVNTISEDTGKPDGQYQDTTDVVLSQDGSRAEHVVFAPQNTLTRVMMSQSDFDDIEHRLPFVLTTTDLPQYNINYLGRQHVDDLDTYVFDVAPKVLEKGKRYFQGKLWIDQADSQIVLVNGKSVPDDTRRGHEDLSPPYTTYYSEVDGHFWFPIYTHAEGTLHFAAQEGATAQDVLIRYTVRYSDYKRFRARSRIIYNGSDLPADGTTSPPPK